MSTILPYRSEFGLKIRFHVPAVYALGTVDRIYIEPGEEALYPNARIRIAVDRAKDEDRHGEPDAELGGRLSGIPDVLQLKQDAPEERFIPQPYSDVSDMTDDIDVVICPRKRKYGHGKNWGGWTMLSQWLPNVFAGGAPDSSYDVFCPTAWERPNFLDRTIQAMLKARLVVATDAGLAHLALLCGRPLFLITHDGLVAPGAQLNTAGEAMEPAYHPVRLNDYYHAANHMNVPITVSGSWMYPKLIKEEILAVLQS